VGRYVFQKSVALAASPEEVFAFHENPSNLAKISPRSLRIRKITCAPKAVPGGRFEVSVSQFGLPVDWIGVWVRVEQPGILVDEAERSPFRFWRHSHIFEAAEGGCLMTDRVEAELPGGRLISALVVPLILGPMFRARHRATREWFAKKSSIPEKPASA
jgi:ligand-binding SRPBCC domain-containing protein